MKTNELNAEKYLATGKLFFSIFCAGFILSGCALLKDCAEWNWFSDNINNCVGQDVNCFTRVYQSAQLTDTVQLAQNRLMYKYSMSAPPSYDGDTYHSCKINLEVDGNTGKLISGQWDGDCDHWSYCMRYED
jgi:hypothetical protein